MMAFCTLNSLQAQQYNFIKVAGNPKRVIPAQNGTFYSVAEIPTCLEYQIHVEFYNRKGELLSSFLSGYFYNNSSSIIHIAGSALPNNHLALIFGNIFGDLYVYELDSNATIIHHKKFQYANTPYTFHTIIPVNSGFYLAGNMFTPLSTDSSKAMIVKLNTDLSLQWARTYRMQGNTASALEFNVVKWQNQKLVCAGHYYKLNPAPVRKRPLICELDSAGNPLLAKYFMADSSSPNFFQEYDFVQVDFTPSGRIYLQADNLVSEHALFKLEPNYQLAWLKHSYAGYATAMCAGYDEDVLISPDLFIRNAVLHLDSAGNVIANHVTASTGAIDISLGQINQLYRHDCGFLAANTNGMYSHVGKQPAYCADSINNTTMPYIFQTNVYDKPAYIESNVFNNFSVTTPVPAFAVFADAVVSVCSNAYSCQGGTSSVTATEVSSLTIYPIPADETVWIKIPENEELLEVLVSDMLGQTVYASTGKTKGVLRINTALFAEGAYAISCRLKNSKAAKILMIKHAN